MGTIPISMGMKVDMELLTARMRNMKANMRDLSKPGREAAKVVKAERNLHVPVRSGRFRKAAYAGARGTTAYVGLSNTGYGSNDYIGVQEFGGTIARYHSKRRTHVKPFIGGRLGTSYYLYPALEGKRAEITEQYREHMADLCAKYMP